MAAFRQIDLTADVLEDGEAHAERLGVHTRTLRRWRDQPSGLPFTRMGSTILYNPAWTREWLESRRVQRNSPPARCRHAA